MLAWKPQFQDARVASVRYRCLNPLSELLKRGLPIELFRESNIANYSGVIFSKAYDDESYYLAEDLKKNSKAVIFDICDNHFYNPYNLEKFRMVRERLLKMLSIADLVVASTDTLADVIANEGRLSSRPVVIGDAVEENDVVVANMRTWLGAIFSERRLSRLKEHPRFNILWYGIHGGENAPYGMLDLLKLKDTLAKISKEFPIRLIIVSNSKKKYKQYIQPLPVETCYFEWGTVSFKKILRTVDLNIIPISKNPFTECKSNNRLTLALYEGVPTIADEIPSYRDLAPFCILNSWEEGLRTYFGNPTIAQEQLAQARVYIEARYMIKNIADQWVAILSKLVQQSCVSLDNVLMDRAPNHHSPQTAHIQRNSIIGNVGDE